MYILGTPAPSSLKNKVLKTIEKKGKEEKEKKREIEREGRVITNIPYCT